MTVIVRSLLACALAATAAGSARAQATSGATLQADRTAATAPQAPQADERWAVHGQLTDIFQYHPAFASAFEGPQSFDRGNHTGNTFDATLYLGVRLWRGAEFWVDPELNQGVAPNNTLGIAGYINGDGAKVGKAHPYTRIQRAFLRETVDLGGGSEAVAPDANVLGATRDNDRLVLTLGKYNATDIFDANIYAHDPRGDFLNWSLIVAGSFDYAADAWGYSYGATAEWYRGDWAARFGLFDLSDVPNSPHLTQDLSQFQYLAEGEHDHQLWGRRGAVRATLFVTRGNMADYREAIADGDARGETPDPARVRRYRSRAGGSLNLEQEVADGVGVFARAGWDDGTLESYEYTDIDRTASAGVSVRGGAWGRKDDVLALAGVVNDISASHTAFFDAGGLGILIGDGRLPHKDTERIFEGYYKAALPGAVELTFDTQLVGNPAYNVDRGPVVVLGVRLHVQR